MPRLGSFAIHVDVVRDLFHGDFTHDKGTHGFNIEQIRQYILDLMRVHLSSSSSSFQQLRIPINDKYDLIRFVHSL